MIVALEEAKYSLNEQRAKVEELGNALRITELRDNAAELEKQTYAEDFWNDLVDEEKDIRLGIQKEDVYNTMYKIACSQKAQMVYAGILAVDYEDLDYASEEFLEFLSDYEYKVNDKVLNRLDFGDITLVHE